MLKYLQFNFYEPEVKIIREGGTEELKRMYITGVGRCFVTKKFLSKQGIHVSTVSPGTIFGELQMIIPNNTDFTLESQQHAILVSISRSDMEQLFR